MKGLNFIQHFVFILITLVIIIGVTIVILSKIGNQETTIPEEAYVPPTFDFEWFPLVVVVFIAGLILAVTMIIIRLHIEEPEQSWFVVSQDKNHILLHNNPNIEQYKKFPKVPNEIINKILNIN